MNAISSLNSIEKPGTHRAKNFEKDSAAAAISVATKDRQLSKTSRKNSSLGRDKA
jgi:hypothetical protein